MLCTSSFVHAEAILFWELIFLKFHRCFWKISARLAPWTSYSPARISADMRHRAETCFQFCISPRSEELKPPGTPICSGSSIPIRNWSCPYGSLFWPQGEQTNLTQTLSYSLREGICGKGRKDKFLSLFLFKAFPSYNNQTFPKAGGRTLWLLGPLYRPTMQASSFDTSQWSCSHNLTWYHWFPLEWDWSNWRNKESCASECLTGYG